MNLDWLWYEDFDITEVGDMADLEGWSGTITAVAAGWDGTGQSIFAPTNFFRDWVASTYDAFVIRTRYMQVAWGTERVIWTLGSGSTTHLELRVTTTGLLKLVNTGSGSFSWTSTGSAMQNGNWLNIETGVKISDTVGFFTIKLDGVVVPGLSQINVDTRGLASTDTASRLTLNNPEGFYDEPYVRGGNNTIDDDDYFTDSLDNPRIAVLHVRDQATFSAWENDTLTGFENFEEIDEILMDNDTSRLSCNGPQDDKDSWFFDALPDDAVDIFDLSTSFFVSDAGAGQPHVNHFLRIGGINSDSSENNLDGLTTPQQIVKRWPLSFYPWTVEAVDGIEAGINKFDATTARARITQATIYVIYSSVSVPPPTIDAPISIVEKAGHFYSSLWKVESKTLPPLYFTDHNAPLIFVDGNTYTPAGGVTASARQKQGQLKEPNVELLGILSSNAITVADIRAGRYRKAKVTEYLVDWMIPQAGAVSTLVYWIEEVKHQGTFYTAQLSGIASRLRNKIGRVYSVNCDYDWGDDRCGVPRFAFTYFGVDVTVVNTRRIFQADANDIPAGKPDDWFNFGFLTWTVGANAGLSFEIKDYTSASRQIELMLPTPFDIVQNVDQFNIEPGCNKEMFGDCTVKYNNADRNGGWFHLPGTDSQLQSPPVEVLF